MKWYKRHRTIESSEFMSIKLKHPEDFAKIILFYDYITEKITENIEKKKVNFEYDIHNHNNLILLNFYGITEQEAEEYSRIIATAGIWNYENGIITHEKLREWADIYTSRILKKEDTSNSVRTHFEHTSNTLRTVFDKNRTEENRIENNRLQTEEKKKEEEESKPRTEKGLNDDDEDKLKELLFKECEWCRGVYNEVNDLNLTDYIYWITRHKDIRNPLAYARSIKDGFDVEEAKANGWKPFEIVKKKARAYINEYVLKNFNRIEREVEDNFDNMHLEDVWQELPEKKREQYELEALRLRRLYEITESTAKKYAYMLAGSGLLKENGLYGTDKPKKVIELNV